MARKAIPIEPYIEKLEHAIRLGATYDLAAMYAGISKRTFQRWRQHASTAKDGTPLAQLRERLTMAEGAAAVGWLEHIEQAARDGNFAAAAWKLERRYPDMYGRRVQADVTVQMRQAAQAVADELGIDVQVILQEANEYLLEAKRGSTP